MKTTKLFCLSLLVISALTLGSCKKDKNEDKRKVEYKVVSSPETSITSVNFTDENGNEQTTDISSKMTSTWSSGEFSMKNEATTLKLSAVAPAIAQTTLKIQILVNGEVKKEETGKGPNNMGKIEVSASY